MDKKGFLPPIHPPNLVHVVFKRPQMERPLMTSHVFWSFLTYLPTLSYSITYDFWGCLFGPTLISDVINGRSHMIIASKYKHNLKKDFTSLCNCIVARVQWCPTLATIVFKKGAKKSKYFFKMIIEGHLCVCLDYIYLFSDAGR